MGARAAVVDVTTPELVLVPPDGRIGNCSVRRAELTTGNGRDRGPESLGGVEVETFVQVHAYAQSRLVDIEEPSHPRAEEPHHAGIRVREADALVVLRPLTGVQRGPGNEECIPVERANAPPTFRVELRHLPQASLA